MQVDDMLIWKLEEVLPPGVTKARARATLDGAPVALQAQRIVISEDERIYLVRTIDRFQSTTYTYLAPEQPFWTQFPLVFDRSPWRLSPCGYDFFAALLDAAEGWRITERVPIV